MMLDTVIMLALALALAIGFPMLSMSTLVGFQVNYFVTNRTSFVYWVIAE